jgi:hypothetical protein
MLTSDPSINVFRRQQVFDLCRTDSGYLMSYIVALRREAVARHVSAADNRPSW